MNQEHGLSNKKGLTLYQLEDKDKDTDTDKDLEGIFRLFLTDSKACHQKEVSSGKTEKQGENFLSVLPSWAWQCKQKYVDTPL